PYVATPDALAQSSPQNSPRTPGCPLSLRERAGVRVVSAGLFPLTLSLKGEGTVWRGVSIGDHPTLRCDTGRAGSKQPAKLPPNAGLPPLSQGEGGGEGGFRRPFPPHPLPQGRGNGMA
ncbi:hypothetical protein CHU33_13360, partial [Superficieibacter electus]